MQARGGTIGYREVHRFLFVLPRKEEMRSTLQPESRLVGKRRTCRTNVTALNHSTRAFYLSLDTYHVSDELRDPRTYRRACGKVDACGGGVRRKYGYIRRLHPPGKQESQIARSGVPWVNPGGDVNSHPHVIRSMMGEKIDPCYLSGSSSFQY